MASSNINKSNDDNGNEKDEQPHVIITEQPSSKGLRFRYECEKKYAAAIFGVKSTLHHKTFPTIKIVNYEKPVRIVVSCVTKEPPYRPHPHNILGKIKEVDNGILDFKYETPELALGFSYLSIQCVKKKDITKSLALREKLKVDPFNTGFDHALNPNSIDLYSLRLCIQLFLEGSTPGLFDVPLTPIVTDPVNDRRNKSDLEIVYITHEESSVTGGTEMCILCERGDNDVEVVFYRNENNWKEVAQFNSTGNLKGVAIVFFTPRYEDQNIKSPVEVKIQLRKTSNGDVSNEVTFKYIPLVPREKNPLKRKREEDICTCEQLQEVLEKNKDQVYIPKNINSCDPWNLPEQINEVVNISSQPNISDLATNAIVYTDPLANNIQSKNENYLNNFQTQNEGKKMASFVEVSNMNPPAPTDNADEANTAETKNRLNFSNTLDSDDWVYELLQTIEEDSKQKITKPEIVKEPEIKYIIPDPMPNMSMTNTIPEVQNHSNFITSNVVNNNHQETPLFNFPNFVEELPSLPEQFATDVSTLANIPGGEEPSQVMSHCQLMPDQHTEYATNINGNQWNNSFINANNEQSYAPMTDYQYFPTQQAHLPNVPNNFNGNSSNNYAMTNGSYGAQMEPINHQTTWHQVQRETLNEFDPIYSTQTWRSNQEYNGYHQ